MGSPFNKNGNDGVKFHSDITDSTSIEALREIIKNEDDIEDPKGLGEVADIFFSLDRPNESIAEIRRYVWYQEDASSILYHDDSGTYSALTKEQTNALKRILNQ